MNESHRVLEYLKKQGQANTFRLARVLKIDRSKVLDIIKDLENKKVLEVRSGVVKFPEEEKVAKPINPQAENEKLKKELLELKETIKKLGQKASTLPKIKIVKRTIIKKIPVETKKELPKLSAPKAPKIVKSIQQLKKPKFIEEKISSWKPKISFTQLNDNIQQLHVPKMFKKGGL